MSLCGEKAQGTVTIGETSYTLDFSGREKRAAENIMEEEIVAPRKVEDKVEGECGINQKNKAKICEDRKDRMNENPEKRRTLQKSYDDKNQESKNFKEAERKEAIKNATTKEQRLHKFNKDIINGPNFICFSCNRVLFIVQVKILEGKTLTNFFTRVENDFLKNEVGVDMQASQLIFCHNCCNQINKGKLPRIHTSNGLESDVVPEELKLKDLEQQLIARNLLFEKIKKLPKTRMHANFDRVINVPIDSRTISKTVTLLPRHPDDANIVAVQLKRKLEMKNSHLSEFIRPIQLVKAVQKLKAIGNPHYQDVTWMKISWRKKAILMMMTLKEIKISQILKNS